MLLEQNAKRSLAPRCGIEITDGPHEKAKGQNQQYLTPPEEKALVQYLLRMAALGAPVRVKYLPSLAFSIARRRPATNALKRATKPPCKNWPQAFTKRHPDLKRRSNRPICWNRHDNNIYPKLIEWFEVIKDELLEAAIPRENWYNMDETGVMLSMLGAIKVLVGKDDRRDYRGAGEKRTMVTAIECISASGEALSPMIIWPASTHRSNCTTYPTPGWVYAFSETGYNDSYLTLEWMKRVFDPQTKARANGKPRVLICDGFGTHETLEVLEFCLENNIILCRLPSHTSHKTQPCDVAVFGPLKTAYSDQVERLYHSGVTVVLKEHFTSLYSPARETAMSKKNILAGWAKAGLFPFNPDRVLRTLEKPLAHLAVRSEVAEESPSHEVLQTPITPVTPEALSSLLTLVRQNPSDELGRRRHQRLVQKLANAAETSLARQALDQDQIEFLSSMNKEAKTRRKTKSEILGRGRVMTYEDIVRERARRAEQKAAIEAKGKRKRGRKPKCPATAADEPSGAGEPAEAAEASHVAAARSIVDGAKGQSKHKRARQEEATARVAKRGKTSETATVKHATPVEVQAIGRRGSVERNAEGFYRAPVAHMY